MLTLKAQVAAVDSQLRFHGLSVRIQLFGLNEGARRDSVRTMLESSHCTVACLQETKTQHLSRQRLHSLICMASNLYLPADGVKGGILVLLDNSLVDLAQPSLALYSISADVLLIQSNQYFRLSVVYGPSEDGGKPAFLLKYKTSDHLKGHRGLSLVISISSTRPKIRAITT